MHLLSTLFSSHSGILPKSLITPVMVASHIPPPVRLAVVASDFMQWEKYIIDVGRTADMDWYEPFHNQYHAIRSKLRHVANITCHSGVPSMTDAASYVNFLGGESPTAPVIKQLNGYTDYLNVLVKGISMREPDRQVPEPDAIVIDGGFRVENVLPAFPQAIPAVIFQMTTLGGDQAIAATEAFLAQNGYRISPIRQSGFVAGITPAIVRKNPIWKAILS